MGSLVHVSDTVLCIPLSPASFDGYACDFHGCVWFLTYEPEATRWFD